MNNIKIAYDGRVTAWNTSLISPKASKAPKASSSEEWELFCALPEAGKEEFLADYLGSSHDVISTKTPDAPPKARRGTKGITSHGRAMIRGGAQYLQERHGVRNLSFLTCTVPESVLAVCTPETWSAVVDSLLKSLRYHLTRVGLSTQIVGCTEVQESRLLREQGRPPLHLHLVFQGRESYGHWKLPKQFFREQWEQSCQAVWGDVQGFQSSTRVESVHSSAVAYLGKYMSKGGDVLSLCKPELLPSSWYTISTKLKAFVKNAVLKLSGSAAHDLYEYLYSGDQMKWARSVMSEYTETGTCYLLAWIGELLNRDTYWGIVNDLREIMYHEAPRCLTGVL